MKIVEGNSYVCLKEWKDIKGRPVPVGAICYGITGGALRGYNKEGIYSDIKRLDNYEEYFTLYEEAPYNKENRELREKYAGLAMQALLSGHYKAFIAVSERTSEPVETIVTSAAVDFADALIAELKKGGVKE